MIVVSIEQCQSIVDRLQKRLMIANCSLFIICAAAIGWLLEHLELIHRMNRLHSAQIPTTAPIVCITFFAIMGAAALYLACSDFYSEYTYRKLHKQLFGDD